jgi:putative hydrolase of the HAD superfamily
MARRNLDERRNARPRVRAAGHARLRRLRHGGHRVKAFALTKPRPTPAACYRRSMITAPPLELAWECIDTVLLDLDGTLLDLHFDNYFFLEHLPARLAEVHGLHPEAARQALRRRYRQVEGTLAWYCLDYWQRELDLDLLALQREIADRVAWRPHARPFLAGLAAGGKQRILATNAHPGNLGFKAECLDVTAAGLTDHLDARFTAHDFGAPKEQAAFWDRLHARVGFDPARTLLIDDNRHVLAAARAWGLPHLLGIRRPDSRRPANALEGFTAVDDFDAVTRPPPA